MSVEQKVCMLCLQSVEESLACCALMENDLLMNKLENIIPDIRKVNSIKAFKSIDVVEKCLYR